MLGLNNPASSKIMIGLLKHLNRAHGEAQMCLNDDTIQNQKENKNRMFNRKMQTASTNKKWIKNEALDNKVQGWVERHKIQEKRKGEKAVEKTAWGFPDTNKH